MPETDALAKRVKRYRSSMNKTQIEFALDAGVSTEELSLIERGLTDPKLSTMQKLAAYIGITVSELLDVEKDIKYD